ncbi:MAG: hypothetical protein R3A46_06895 [Thermomicrobiales bacterium]
MDTMRVAVVQINSRRQEANIRRAEELIGKPRRPAPDRRVA